jgi:holliday junction DNA helicase RuvB
MHVDLSGDDEDMPPPKTEIDHVRPTSLSHLIGQQSVKQQVTVAIEAAFADNRRFDHALMVGPAGVGKSALASIIAAEMATDLHEVLGQWLKGPADLNALLLAAKDGDVIHIDEAHELDKRRQTALYMALDRRVLVPGGNSGRKPTPIPLSDFTLLLSTTDEYRLLQPLRDRMRLNLRFQFYRAEELIEIVRQRAQALRWQVEDVVAEQIAVRGRGIPRVALGLLQSSYRVSRARGGDTIVLGDLNRACELEQLDSMGLNITEQKYMDLLWNGATPLNMLATTLGLPPRTVADVTESYLIRAGLVTKNGSALRELTAAGRERVAQSRRHQPTRPSI